MYPLLHMLKSLAFNNAIIPKSLERLQLIAIYHAECLQSCAGLVQWTVSIEQAWSLLFNRQLVDAINDDSFLYCAITTVNIQKNQQIKTN